MKTKLLSTLVLASLLSACGGPEGVRSDEESFADIQNASKDSTQVGGLNNDDGISGSALDAADVSNVSYEKNAINDPASPLVERVIYFDFDNDQVSSDYLDLLVHHGKYLAANPSMKLRIEGHADERGSREYNIALGNRRAQSVRRLVLFQGADANQVDVISYGEEKPVALNHDEEAWRLNRRVELVYEAR